MVKNEFSFPSQDGRTAIHAAEWLPEGEPRAVVQLAHGVSEYLLRYEPLAAFLTERGFAAVGGDHLGHGRSVAPGAARLSFGPAGNWDTVVDDLYTLRGLEGRKLPGRPYFLLGHSMGSFLARTYLVRYPGTLDGAILMGTGQMPPPMVAAGLAVAAAECRRVGESRPSPAVERLAFATYNKVFAPNRTPFDWLSADTDNVDAYLRDPLCGENPSVGLFRELLRGMRFITRQRNVERMNLDTPVLFVSGAMDPVGDCGKGVRRAFDSFRRAGVRDLDIRLYPGARHEILNDFCREEVLRDLAAWLEDRVPAAV